MHFKWNLSINRVLATSVLAVLASTGLYALPKSPCDTKPDVCCEEPKPGPFAFAYPMDMGLNCPKDFYIHADAIIFQAKQDGMEFVIEDSNAGTSPLMRGYVDGFSNDHTDWQYNEGLRFGGGFYLSHDAWALDFNWTWLNITDYKHANADAGDTLVPLWALGSSSGSDSVGARSSAVWDADYNVLDARLMKAYHVSRYFIMNPHFGLRAGWIDQHFSVHYSGAAVGDSFVHHGQNDFWGFGARTGVETSWILGKGWSLFGNVACSLLYGKFTIDQSLDLPGSADGFDLDYDFYQNVPNMEIAMGIAWGRHFSKNRYHAGLAVGYEFHEWFDQLNMRKFFSSGGNGTYGTDVVSRGNLTLNGFSIKLQLDI